VLRSTVLRRKAQSRCTIFVHFDLMTSATPLSRSSVPTLILTAAAQHVPQISVGAMKKHQRFLKSVAIAVLMALFAVACGGGGEEAAIVENAGQPAVSFDGEDVDTATAPIPTTAPLTVDSGATEVEPTVVEAAETSGEGLPDEDPWLVDVLHANDDALIIPTFDGPGGAQITIYDVNPIDGIDLEYPLYAETHFGNRLALLVEEFDSSGNWAKVLLPVRPNGSTAWVQTAFFTTESHNYHITIDVSENTVNVFRGEELLVEQIAVSGKEGRETPVVRAYIDEKIAGPSLSPAYGDWVLSIAAFSETLGTFGNGIPKLALHGTNQPELMGQYVSSGCVRIPNAVVSFIADTVPVGTVVNIIA